MMKFEIDSADATGIAAVLTVLGAAIGWIWAKIRSAMKRDSTAEAEQHKADASLAADVIAPLLHRIAALEQQVHDERKRSTVLEGVVRMLMRRVEQLRVKARVPDDQWRPEESAAILAALGAGSADLDLLPDDIVADLRRNSE